MVSYGKSHMGLVRKNNEDRIFLSDEPVGNLPNLYIVADGMGGHPFGNLASELAVSEFVSFAEKQAHKSLEDILDTMFGSLHFANERIYERGMMSEEFVNMGTTFTASVIHREKLFMVHIGDSRLYIFSENKLQQLSQDHSYVMELVRNKKLSLEEAKKHPGKHAITRALGLSDTITIDNLIYPLPDHFILLLCSDGLSNMVADPTIQSVLEKNCSLDQKTEQLIEEALRSGGTDNISIILAERTC